MNANNSNSNSFFFSTERSRAKKLEQPEWTWFYKEEDFPDLMEFVVNNLTDLPQYREHTREQITRLCYIGRSDRVMNYEWIFERYTDLRIYYAETATQMVMDYVNTEFQRGLNKVIRPTLNLLITLFGPYILEKFERDFSMVKCKEVILEEFRSERYENAAYLIVKEHANMEDARVHYKPQMGNSFESKKAALRIIELSDLLYLNPMRHQIGRHKISLDPKAKKELEAYDRIVAQNWSPCLPNEYDKSFQVARNAKTQCVSYPYLKLTITDEDILNIKFALTEITKEIALLPNQKGKDVPSDGKVSNIIKIYNLTRYIGNRSGRRTASIGLLREYATEKKIAFAENTTEDELAFLLLIDIFASGMMDRIKRVLPGFMGDHIDSMSKYISVITGIRQAFNLVAPYKSPKEEYSNKDWIDLIFGVGGLTILPALS